MSEELKPCPFCIQDSQPHIQTRGNRGRKYVVCPKCLANGPFVPIHDDDSRAIAAWNRRTPTAPEAGQTARDAGSELPPIDYDKSLDRTYIPLPGGWEIQTKGNGSTFRIAHVPSRTRWQVLDGNLHEPLEGLAREMRNHIADLRAQLAAKGQEPVLGKSPEFAGKSPETRMDAGFHGAGNFAPQPAALLEQVTREEEPNWRALGYVEGATVRFNVAGGGSQDGVIKWAHGNGSLDVECDGKTFGWSARYCDVVAAPSSQGEQTTQEDR